MARRKIRKAHTYRAARRNLTLHRKYIERKVALARAGRARHNLQRKRRVEGTHTVSIKK